MDNAIWLLCNGQLARINILCSIPVATEELGLPEVPLNSMFKNLIEALLTSSGSYQRVRTNLYGALMYYLQIGKHEDEQHEETGKTRDIRGMRIVKCSGEIAITGITFVK